MTGIETTDFRWDVLLLVVVMFVFLWTWHRHSRRSIAAKRRTMFEKCIDLIDGVELTQDNVNYPIIEGRYRGYRLRVEPIVDQVVFRKLPSLWLAVTVYAPIPYAGVLDFLARPQNTEFYSPWASLPVEVDIPEGWPRHAVLRTDDASGMPPQEVLSPFIEAAFEDLKMKEVLVTPRGVRVVYQGDQAQRSHYLVLRQPLFENFQVEPELLTRLMDLATGVARTLADGAARTDAAAPSAERDAPVQAGAGVLETTEGAHEELRRRSSA